MERRPNPRTARGRRVHFANTPQDQSRARPDVSSLQRDLDYAHSRTERLQSTVEALSRQTSDLLTNREKLCKTLHNYKWQINRLEGLLELREREFKTEFKNSYATITSFEAQVSSLKQELQSKNEEIDRIQLLRNQETDTMTARLESEKKKVQESAELQNNLQQKLKWMEQQLLQKDKEILDLQRNNHDLSHKLTKVSAEFQNNTWQSKYNALQEKFTEELAAKQKSCEATKEQLVEEKKKLEELQLKIKIEKTEKDKKDQEIRNKDQQEINRLSQKLTERTSELRSCRVEFLQAYKAWQGEYNALEEKYKEQLIQKQKDSEKTSQLVEEEKNSLSQKQQDSEETSKLVEEEKNSLPQKEDDSEETSKLVEEEKNSLPQKEDDSEETSQLVEEEKNSLPQKEDDSEETSKLVEEEKNSLPQKEDDSEETSQLVEEEKNSLPQKEDDSEETSKLVEEEKNSLPQKEDDPESSQERDLESQEEGAMSNEGTAATSGSQMVEKKKKNWFLRWFRKKKRRDSQTQGEEAPCSSTQVTQQ